MPTLPFIHSLTHPLTLFLCVDVNADLFPARANERMTVAMANTLNLDGTADDGQYNADPGVSVSVCVCVCVCMCVCV